MKTTTAEIESELIQPPLARDALGNLLPLPDGTAAWRICRHTLGRPRVIMGPDKQPMRFPLAITVDELVELCGPDIYRVYALDEIGNDLGHVNTIQATREPRNSNEPEVPLSAAVRITQPVTPMTDLRYALETITQIARINGEALRSVSASQADWIKAIAMAKGLPRNVAYPMLPPPREYDDDEYDDDGRDDDDDEPAPPQDPTLQIVTTVAPLFGQALSMLQMKLFGAKPADVASNTVPGIAHLAQIQTQLAPKERELLGLLLTESNENDLKQIASRSVDEMVAYVKACTPGARRRVASDDPPFLNAAQLETQLRKRAPALLMKLSPDARTRLMTLAPRLDATRLAEPLLLRKLNELVMLDDDDAVKWIESNLDEIERMVMS
jgi:hypothetical protein